MSHLARSLAFALCLTGCGGAGLVGNGKPTAQTRTVGAFKQLELAGGAHVTFTKGPRAVAITADENLIDHVQLVVSGDVLAVRLTRPIADPASIKIAISNDVLEAVAASGGSSFVGPVSAVSAVSAGTLSLEASGASSIQVSDVAATKVLGNISGASEVVITGGAATVLTLSVSGASTFASHGFIAEDGVVDLSGASSACVACSKSITGNASGASTLTVSGSPAVTRVNSSGGSRLIQEN